MSRVISHEAATPRHQGKQQCLKALWLFSWLLFSSLRKDNVISHSIFRSLSSLQTLKWGHYMDWRWRVWSGFRHSAKWTRTLGLVRPRMIRRVTCIARAKNYFKTAVHCGFQICRYFASSSGSRASNEASQRSSKFLSGLPSRISIAHISAFTILLTSSLGKAANGKSNSVVRHGMVSCGSISEYCTAYSRSALRVAMLDCSY